MENGSRFISLFAANAAWQVVVVAIAALAGAWLLRRGPAGRQHTLWQCALAACILLPLVTLFGITPEVAAPQGELPVANAAVRFRWIWSLTLPPAILFLLSGVAILAAAGRWIGLFGKLRATRDLLRSAHAIDCSRVRRVHPRIQRLSAECESILGLRPIPVRFVAGLEGPATAGVLKPVVLLPESFLSQSDEVLTAALGHELAHIRRRDFAWRILEELLFCPLAFHPVMIFIRRKLNESREMACDEMVSENILDRRRYASCLLSIAASTAGTPMLAVAISGEDPESLKHRIERLVAGNPSKRGRVLSSTLAALLFIAAGLIASMGAVRPGFAANAAGEQAAPAPPVPPTPPPAVEGDQPPPPPPPPAKPKRQRRNMPPPPPPPPPVPPID